jgi:GntR family transcriptional regulator
VQLNKWHIIPLAQAQLTIKDHIVDIAFPVQLQQSVEQAILAGRLEAGQLFAVEALAAQFSAPGEAMRAVLLAEHRKGLVKQQGALFEIVGITGPTVDSLFQHASKAGQKPESAVRAAVIVPCPEAAAAKLDMPAGAPAYRLVRTRMVDDQVLANQTNYIPFEICPGLERDDLSHFSFQKLLEQKYHTVIPEMKEDIRIVPGTDADLEILSLPPGAPVLVVERLSFSANHLPVVWADIHIRTDRYHLVASLWPEAAAVLQASAGTSAPPGQ